MELNINKKVLAELGDVRLLEEPIPLLNAVSTKIFSEHISKALHRLDISENDHSVITEYVLAEIKALLFLGVIQPANIVNYMNTPRTYFLDKVRDFIKPMRTPRNETGDVLRVITIAFMGLDHSYHWMKYINWIALTNRLKTTKHWQYHVALGEKQTISNKCIEVSMLHELLEEIFSDSENNCFVAV